MLMRVNGLVVPLVYSRSMISCRTVFNDVLYINYVLRSVQKWATFGSLKFQPRHVKGENFKSRNSLIFGQLSEMMIFKIFALYL